ncbi:hypothetical protein [Lacisediminihabitans sp. H27-G8]|uniref:hypothetical protein n=1 Tax=Lacisediminihabitans sp. H27-G8 TaxID=3111909 RepID=UPI0038FC2551
MAPDEKTQDEPIMDGATEAKAQEKLDGGQDQARADAKRDATLDARVREVGGDQAGDDPDSD